MFRPELLKKSFSCFGSPVRLFRSESTKGVRFRHRRQSHHPSQILLDKFVKHAKVDASLVVKAPFSLKIKVSSFLEQARNRPGLQFAVERFPI